MGPSSRQLGRVLLPLGVAAVGCVLSIRAEDGPPRPPVQARLGYPEPHHAQWRPQNLVNLPPPELAARMGFGERIDGLLRGQPKETERFYWEDGDDVNLLAGGSSSDPAARLEEPPPVDPEAALGGVTPEEVEASVADILGLVGAEDEDDPMAAPDPAAIDAYLRREGLAGRLRVVQSVAGGFLDSESSSVANGSTTTESRYLEHHIQVSRPLDHRTDLAVGNDLLVDVLKIRNTSDVSWSRQVDTAGRLGASFSFTRQDSDEAEGEIEPDHNLGSFQLSGGRDTQEGLSWDVTGYGTSLDYDGVDDFFLDRRQLGVGATGTYVAGAVELFGRHQVERDRYPDASQNDASRILSQLSVLTTPRWDLEVVYNSTYEREGIRVQTDLDSYRAWTTEGVVRKLFGDRLTFTVTVGKRSQTVDQISLFLFDSREYYLWPELDFQVTPALAARVGYRDAAVRNRPKAPAGLPTNETIDDRDVNDWELGVEYVGPVFDASILGYFGTSRHLNGEAEAFASFDRRGVAITFGFRAGRLGRGEFTFSEDHEEYPTFAINDNRARTTGARYVVQF